MTDVGHEKKANGETDNNTGSAITTEKPKNASAFSTAARPGVPMEFNPPRPTGHAHWETPPKQEATVEVLKHTGRDELTPVFSNAIPPRLLSGMIRRAAYKTPDYSIRHWLMLIMSDRVDEMEHRLLTPAGLTIAAGTVLATAGFLGVRARRRRRTWLDRVRALA
jgi:hypothetical protein